eukprot:TRINITY_DN65972_c0_g1_i1.p1 TRINITY_DN65972_c0_g1~~TRINITY_DN65972_c0_g1_i1.p1  ORF type:complete len:199 (-),score=7.71 TRINITY_DN65972_c0_g1_i1:2-598(-)
MLKDASYSFRDLPDIKIQRFFFSIPNKHKLKTFAILASGGHRVTITAHSSNLQQGAVIRKTFLWQSQVVLEIILVGQVLYALSVFLRFVLLALWRMVAKINSDLVQLNVKVLPYLCIFALMVEQNEPAFLGPTGWIILVTKQVQNLFWNFRKDLALPSRIPQISKQRTPPSTGKPGKSEQFSSRSLKLNYQCMATPSI